MISVVMATHNGATTLPRTLAALQRVTPPPGGVEFIAVDNASTDATPAILREGGAPLGLRILREPRQGKSFALNRGIEAARGELIVFTDDDVIPEPDWLTAWAATGAAHPETGIFAGQVRHEWDAPPPRWLEELAAAGMSYAGTSVFWPAGPLRPDQAKGPNLMARRAVMGPVRFSEEAENNFSGGASAGGEDVRFVRDMADRCGGLRYVPEASLRHIVRGHQIGLRPVFRRYMRIGATEPMGAEGGTLLGWPVQGLRAAARQCCGGLRLLVRGRRTDAAKRMVALAVTLGRMREGRRLRAAAKAGAQPSSAP